jgi:hypothetical protein
MDTNSPGNRVLLAPVRLLVKIAAGVRRVLGGAFQVLFHDQLGELNRQTQRLGSASVESATHLGTEMAALDKRLARIEAELATLRKQTQTRPD